MKHALYLGPVQGTSAPPLLHTTSKTKPQKLTFTIPKTPKDTFMIKQQFRQGVKLLNREYAIIPSPDAPHNKSQIYIS